MSAVRRWASGGKRWSVLTVAIGNWCSQVSRQIKNELSVDNKIGIGFAQVSRKHFYVRQWVKSRMPGEKVCH